MAQEMDSSKQKSIATHLETVVRGCTESINNRTFDAASHWQYISEDFEVTHDTGSRPATHSKKELIEGFKHVCQEFPWFRLEIFSCNVDVDGGNGRGQVFANAQESGGPSAPKGVIARKHIAVFDFERGGDGVWKAVREATIFGLGVDGGMGGGLD